MKEVTTLNALTPADLVRPETRPGPLVLDERAVWDLDDVASYLKLSRRKVDYLRKERGFPRSVALGGGYPRFLAGHVMRWFESQISSKAS